MVVTVALSDVKTFESALGDFPYMKNWRSDDFGDGGRQRFLGTIDWWKDKYDTAIERFLAREQAGSALSAI